MSPSLIMQELVNCLVTVTIWCDVYNLPAKNTIKPYAVLHDSFLFSLEKTRFECILMNGVSALVKFLKVPGTVSPFRFQINQLLKLVTVRVQYNAGPLIRFIKILNLMLRHHLDDSEA